ncbi:MAG: MBL fold metallo-hydrolase [Phycisphaerae bacterium]
MDKQLGGIRIVGFSLAGEEAVVAAPEYNVCFDVGRAPREVVSIDNICLTHGHMDHAAGVAYYFSQRTFVGNSPGRVIVHRGLAQSIQKLMDIWSDIEGHPSPCEVYGVEPLEDVLIRRGLLIRPFMVNHTAHSLGYTLIEVRHKLKPEFHGKSGPQLVALKCQGIEIESRMEAPLLTYTGDTAIGRWLRLDFVQRSRGVILECTFFDREHVSRARAGRHIHVSDLPEILAALPESQIMLAHLTRRTDLRHAKHILEQVIKPDDLERVSFLMERLPRGEGRQSPNPQSFGAKSRITSPTRGDAT